MCFSFYAGFLDIVVVFLVYLFLDISLNWQIILYMYFSLFYVSWLQHGGGGHGDGNGDVNIDGDGDGDGDDRD